ncbi:MAG: MFS transporter, partial [Leisingera sp.]
TGFLGVTFCFGAAGFAQGWPMVSIVLLVAGSAALILLDICAGLPFLMAVKPSERTEMSAVYSSYRDISGILTPGAAWLVLLAAPVAGIFTAGAIAAAAAAWLAGKLHPRLGVSKLSPPVSDEAVPAE